MVPFHSVLTETKTFEKQLFVSHEVFQIGRKGQILLNRDKIITFPSQMFVVNQIKLV